MVHLDELLIRGARQQDYVKLDSMFGKYAPSDRDRDLYKILQRIDPRAIRIVTDGGRVVGCAYGHDHGEGLGVVAGLFLIKKYRDSRVASALIQSCTQHLRDIGCTDIVSMVFQQDPFVDCYQDLGFKIWGRKTWAFIQLPEMDLSDSNHDSDYSLLSGQHDIGPLIKSYDIIPSNFWYRRVSDAFVQSLRGSGRTVFEYSNGSISAAIWQDSSALKVCRKQRDSYFLFNKPIGDAGVATPVVVREVSFIHGDRAANIVKYICRNAMHAGIHVMLIHCNAVDAGLLSDLNVRFTTPRIVLRTSLGISLDSFMRQGQLVAS